jgi:hypothetical protein
MHLSCPANTASRYSARAVAEIVELNKRHKRGDRKRVATIKRIISCVATFHSIQMVGLLKTRTPFAEGLEARAEPIAIREELKS